MSIEINNRTREIPEEPHWDKEGRANFLRATCPHPHGERLAQEIELNRGYIRGDRAEVFYGVLRPHLERREMERVVAVGNVQEPQGEIK